MDQKSESERERQHDQQADVRIELQVLIRCERSVHTQDHEVTVTEIDDTHHTKNQAHARADHGVNAAG